jgi:SAM-dependent methyltransferase
VIDLRRRSAGPELMDTEATDPASVEACLRDLERINRWTGAYRITLRWLARLLDRHGLTRPLVVVDVGCGYGDMLRRIAAFAEHRNVAVDLIGVDLNPHAAAAAARATAPGCPIRYLTRDLFDLPRSIRPDVVISALFAHHLDDAQLVRFLHWMDERALLGWLINDLRRHVVPYLIARFAPALLRMNRMVRNDASVSVARAFERQDWEQLLETAGLAAEPTTVAACFPFRFAVGRIKPPA